MFCLWWCLPQGIDDRRALDHDGGLLVPGQMCYWRLVNASSGVDVDSVDDFRDGLGVLVF